MTVKTYDIELRQGERVRALLTPALYGVASRKGIDLTAEINGASKDVTAMARAYAKMAYCAAINQWEVERVDNPSAPDFAYSFSDFDTWSWENQKDLLGFIDAVLLAFTGKGLSEQKEAAGEGLKKKTRK